MYSRSDLVVIAMLLVFAVVSGVAVEGADEPRDEERASNTGLQAVNLWLK